MSYQIQSYKYALSQIIHEKSLDDRTTNCFIYGEPRIGKSVYCMKVMQELWNGDDEWRDYVFFKPKMWLSKIREDRSKGKKSKGMLLDDFGLWGFAWDWTDPDLKSAIKILQVAGTLTDSIFITAPSTQMVVKKVLTLEGILVGKVVKAKTKNQKDEREITMYRNGLAPWGKRYINTICEDRFNVMLKDRDYEWYKPMREAYVDEARKQMELALRA